MRDTPIFPREEKAEVLFQKILDDPWACNKLFRTFNDYLFCNDDSDTSLSSNEFAQALFDCYTNKDLSAFLMAITQNTLFDLLRNAFLIPYRFNADGTQNPLIMTAPNGVLLPDYQNLAHDKDYQHFYSIYSNLINKKNIFFAKAYRYSHTYAEDSSTVEQRVLKENTGILLIRELPDTVKLKETEAEAYSAVWELMLELEKKLPTAYIFYGQDSFVEDNKRFDELGIFLPNSIFLHNLEHHVEKAEAIIYAKD